MFELIHFVLIRYTQEFIQRNVAHFAIAGPLHPFFGDPFNFCLVLLPDSSLILPDIEFLTILLLRSVIPWYTALSCAASSDSASAIILFVDSLLPRADRELRVCVFLGFGGGVVCSGAAGLAGRAHSSGNRFFEGLVSASLSRQYVR